MTAHLDLYILPVLGEHFYTYTPFSAIAFLPIGLLPGGLRQASVAGDERGCAGRRRGVVLAAARATAHWRRRGVSALLAIGFVFVEPVRTTLFYGQINLVLLLLVLCDNACRPRTPLRGLGTGLAAGIKLMPAYFVVYYLTIRQWRAAIVAARRLRRDHRGGMAGAPARLAGVLGRHVPQHVSRGGGSAASFQPVAARGARPAVSGHPTSVVEPLAGKPAPVWLRLPVTGVVLAVSMWLAVRLYRIGERLLSVSVTGLTATVVSPFSWTHHSVWVLPVMVYVVHRATASGSWWPAAAALFAILGAWPYRFPADEQPRTGLYMFPDKWVPWECLANLYLLLYAAIMIGAAMIAYRRPACRRAR